MVAALSLLRADGWLRTRHGSGSAVRLPARLTERTAPGPWTAAAPWAPTWTSPSR
ncbi:hypothetical protein ACFQ3Z_40770 [Streptomyces nogalater]